MNQENNKIKYKNVKNAIVASASGSIMAGMLLIGSGNVYAKSLDAPSLTGKTEISGMHLMHRWNSATKVGPLANHLGLDPVMIKQEMKEGKTLKQILKENGVVPGEIGRAFNLNKKSHMKRLYKELNAGYESWQ